jgi:probable HAF family extracellular repeat protein
MAPHHTVGGRQWESRARRSSRTRLRASHSQIWALRPLCEVIEDRTLLASIVDLGTLGGASSNATGINDSSQVVGWANPAGSTARHAFLYSGGVMSDLGHSEEPKVPRRGSMTRAR